MKKAYLIGGSLAALSLGAGYFLISKGNTSEHGGQSLEKAVVVQSLKDFKKEFFSIFSAMAGMAQQIAMQAQGRASAEELKEFISSHPSITQEIKNAEAKVYSKNNITEKAFKYACEVTYVNDEEIQQMQKELKDNFERSAKGMPPDSTTTIPEFLTSDKTIEVIKAIMKSSAEQMKNVFVKLKEQGEDINLQSPKIVQALNGIRMEEVKSEILASHGLDKFDDPPSKILQYATQQYTKSDPQFGQKMMELDTKHRQAMEMVMTDPINADIESTFEQDVSMGMGGMFGNMMGRIGNRQTKAAPKAEEQKVEKVERLPTEDDKVEKTEEKTEEKAEEKAEQKPEEKLEEKAEEKQEENAEVAGSEPNNQEPEVKEE